MVFKPETVEERLKERNNEEDRKEKEIFLGEGANTSSPAERRFSLYA